MATILLSDTVYLCENSANSSRAFRVTEKERVLEHFISHTVSVSEFQAALKKLNGPLIIVQTRRASQCGVMKFWTGRATKGIENSRFYCLEWGFLWCLMERFFRKENVEISG